MIADI